MESVVRALGKSIHRAASLARGKLRSRRPWQGLWLLSMATIIGTVVQFTPSSSQSANAADRVVGTWIREADSYAGWVINVVSDENNGFEGRSLWVPGPALAVAGFQIGELKLKNLTPRKDGDYSGYSLRRTEDGSRYEDYLLTINESDHLVMTTNTPSGELGDRQTWRRLLPSDKDYAFAECGLGVISNSKGNFKAASKHYRQAASMIIASGDKRGEASLLRNALAFTLATSRSESIRDPKLAAKVFGDLGSGSNPNYADTGAAIDAALGLFEKAIANQERALQLLDTDEGRQAYGQSFRVNSQSLLGLAAIAPAFWEMEKAMKDRLRLYQRGVAYIDDPREHNSPSAGPATGVSLD